MQQVHSQTESSGVCILNHALGQVSEARYTKCTLQGWDYKMKQASTQRLWIDGLFNCLTFSNLILHSS